MDFSMILLILIGVAVGWLVFTYNRLIRFRMRAMEAWADIEVQLKRRYNLIPNLVQTVKGYVKHEKGVLTEVTEARAAAIGAEGIKEQAQAENMLTQALRSVFAVAENYPQLRAVESFLGLQHELTDTEDKIQAARRFYNGNVRDLNIGIQTFPTNLIAGMFGFTKMEFFEIEEEAARTPVEVDFEKPPGRAGKGTRPASPSRGGGQAKPKRNPKRK